jgi:hypothetical protein
LAARTSLPDDLGTHHVAVGRQTYVLDHAAQKLLSAPEPRDDRQPARTQVRQEFAHLLGELTTAL